MLKYNTRISYWDSLANVAHQSNFIRAEAKALANIGGLYHLQGNDYKAAELYNKRLDIFEKIGDKKEVALCLIDIGGIYDDQGDIPKAMEYYSRSLKINETIGDKAGIASSLINLGTFYYYQKDEKKALDYFQKSLKIREELGDKTGMSVSLNNIAGVYDDIGDTVKAVEFYNKSLQMAEEQGSIEAITLALNNLGYFYKKHEQPDRALLYYERCVKLQEQIGLNGQLSNTLNNIGSLFLSKGDLHKGLDYSLRALELAKKVNKPDIIRRASLGLYRIYKKLNNFDQALRMHELSFQMRDSLNNQKNTESIAKQQFKYEFEKKEAFLKDEQEKKDILSKASNKRQQIIIICGALGFLFLVVFAFFMYRSNTQKQKINSELADKNTVIAEKQKEIIDSIIYAKRIQSALLPGYSYIERTLNRLSQKNN